MFRFKIKIVGIGTRMKSDLFKKRNMLILLLFLFAFLYFVFELTKINDLTYRGISLRSNFNKVLFFFLRNFQRVSYGKYA